MNTIERCPELILGPNPFIQEGAAFVPFDQWGNQLRRAPLHDVPWQSLQPQMREALIPLFEQHFVPHRGIIVPAADLQGLYRAGLVRRNPLAIGERTRTLRVANAKSLKDLLLCPHLDGGGGIWAGMTGTGRSSLAKRVVEIIVPERVMQLGSSRACGWDNLTHVPCIYVDFSTNGSRGGILKRILFALDQLVGTSLSDDFRKVTNIDVLLLEVCRQLSNVRCVLLIIDEKQEQNFEDSPWKVEFILFYLSLMNLGINVVLLGNPLAFVHLESFAQVMRRFSRAGYHHFLPAESASDPWWAEDFMPRIRKFNLVDHWDIDPQSRSRLEFNLSGGISAFGAAINAYAQLAAIRRAKAADRTVTVTAGDFETAAASPQYAELLKIAGAVQGSSAERAAYLDVPHAAARGGASSKADGPTKAEMSAISKSDLSLTQRMLARFTAQHTRRARSFVDRLKSLQGLSPEDLRLLGVEQSHLDELRKTIAAQPGKPPGKKGKAGGATPDAPPA